MKKLLVFAVIGMMVFSLVGCDFISQNGRNGASQSTSQDPAPVTTPDTTPETTPDAMPEPTATPEPVIIEASDISNLDDLTTLSTLESQAISVKLLSSAALDDNGYAMFDDANEFAVVATVGNQNFVLLDRQMIQLGMPQVSMFENLDGKTFIILSDVRTAQYNVFEYTYEESLGGFSVCCLTQNEGINYIGAL